MTYGRSLHTTVCHEICRVEGWRALAAASSSSSFFFLPPLHLIQKDRCDFQMRSFVSVSRWLTSPPLPATITVACGITPGGGGGDPLIYYGLSAGAARVTWTVSCVLIRAHPIRGGEERRRSGVFGRSTKSPEM